MSIMRTRTLQSAFILAVLVVQTHAVPAMATADVDQVVPEHDVVPVDDTKFLETSATTPHGYEWVEGSASGSNGCGSTTGRTSQRGVNNGYGTIAHTFDDCVNECNSCPTCAGFQYNGADVKGWNGELVS